VFTGSNHYGIAGFYSLQALKAGLLVRTATQIIAIVSGDFFALFFTD